MKHAVSTLALVGICLTTGCAMTRQTVPLQTYSAASVSRVVQPNQSRPVTVTQVVDKRSVSDPAHLFHKFNAYGPTTGSFVAQRPVADIVRDCLLDAMSRAGYSVRDESGPLPIICEIQDFDIKLKMGMWSGEASSELTLKMTINQDVGSGVLWRDTIIGRGKTTPTGFDYGQGYVVKCFTLALDDAVKQFVENEEVLRLTSINHGNNKPQGAAVPIIEGEQKPKAKVATSEKSDSTVQTDKSPAEKLKELKELKDQQLITDEEYETKRKHLVDQIGQ